MKLAVEGWKGSRLEKYKSFDNSCKKSSQVTVGSPVPRFPQRSVGDTGVVAPCARLPSLGYHHPTGTALCRVTQVAPRGNTGVLYTSHTPWRGLCRVICGFNCLAAPGTVRRCQNCAARLAPEGPGSLGVARVGGCCTKCVNKLSRRIKLVGDK